MLKKCIFYFTVIIYLFGILYGSINSKIEISLLFNDISIEKVLFMGYNLYIIISIIIIGCKLIKTKDTLYVFYIYSIMGYIIFHFIYFIWEIYKILIIYNFKTDAHLLIANALINPTGALPNIVIPFILLQITINLHQEKL
ncbi:MAG: hypothetical protein GX347_01480 [Epulopiscium sp.]|nr:hypothetical protein [Candidatus Epulonipiscium sp.]